METERSRGAEEERAWRQRQSEAKKKIKTLGQGKAGDRGESWSPVSPVWSPQGLGPPLLFFGFHSNKKGSSKFAYTFTSFQSA